ncbi:MAG: 23S rRNA (adenine(2503)-C(2))-methyltransferase RlmN [Planctomycetota bacterium]
MNASDSVRRALPDHDPDSLAGWLAQHDTPWSQPFRAKQLLQHWFHRFTPDYAAMSDLPAGLRDLLADELPIDPLREVDRQDDAHGSTKLAVMPFDDGGTRGNGVVECVIMRDATRDSRTICISTQIGCAMGCRFCASGLGGLVRNLTAGEILAQVWHAGRILHAEGHGSGGTDGRRGRRARASAAKESDGAPTITNIVFMGVGEPLANITHTLAALRAITEPWGFAMSPRRVTVSTVGLVPGIYRLAESGIGVNLAISLHAADDETRARIMPARPGLPPGATAADVADATVERLMDAADHYFGVTGREVTIEFILLPGVNDHQAAALADLIHRHKAGRYNVNVIPYNRVSEFEWREPTDDETSGFLSELRDRGVNVHARKRMGYGIDGACGQLRLNRANA